MTKKYFLDLEPAQIDEYILKKGLTKYRAHQLLQWVYKKKAEDFSGCSVLPLSTRNDLENEFYLRSFKINDKKTSRIDSSVKYTFTAVDGFTVITVLLPKKNRNSICLSTQIGCSVGCLFCASGRRNFKRNLTRGEIVEQVIQVEKDSGAKIDSILFMGMGEPLLNYVNVVSAIKSMTDQNQFGYGRRRIVISTIGLVPQIKKLSEKKIEVGLALSLHAADDYTRKKIIPGKLQYPVKKIIKSGIKYSNKTKSRLTIEYVLLAGINDTASHASELAKLIRRNTYHTEHMQINLIPYNPAGFAKWTRPGRKKIERFKELLVKKNLLTIIRESKGPDIGAACGQLGVK